MASFCFTLFLSTLCKSQLFPLGLGLHNKLLHVWQEMINLFWLNQQLNWLPQAFKQEAVKKERWEWIARQDHQTAVTHYSGSAILRNWTFRAF